MHDPLVCLWLSVGGGPQVFLRQLDICCLCVQVYSMDGVPQVHQEPGAVLAQPLHDVGVREAHSVEEIGCRHPQ